MKEIHPTKLSIIKAAVDIFIKKGFSGATTKEIAHTAGISEGAVFRHFPSKAEILYCIVRDFITIMGVDTLNKTMEECRDLEIGEAVRRIIGGRMEIIRESAVLVRLILVESNYDEKLKEIYVNQVYKPIHQIIYDFFEDRIRRGDLNQIDPNIPTNIIISFVLYEVFGSAIAEDEKADFSAEQLADILLDGIRKRGEVDV